jgi:hypothetical protein
MRWVEWLAHRVSRVNREAKLRQFLALLAPGSTDTILDVGVNDVEYSESDNYLEKHYPFPENIVAVAHKSAEHFAARYPAIRVVVADGRSLPFGDDEFDIAYSNAVVEHTGNRAQQLAFVRELYRVAPRGYLTTPNRRFPVEVHTRIPLLHLVLPRSWFDALLRLTGKGWATGSYMTLLSLHDLESLLRAAGIADYRIVRNRVLGLTMTFSVTWTKGESGRRPAER